MRVDLDFFFFFLQALHIESVVEESRKRTGLDGELRALVPFLSKKEIAQVKIAISAILHQKTNNHKRFKLLILSIAYDNFKF